MTTLTPVYYKTNNDVVAAVAQCADYIKEHAEHLIGVTVGNEIKTCNLEITIKIEPQSIPTVTVNKDTLVPFTIPFSDKEL